jgi:hypothetical protein
MGWRCLALVVWQRTRVTVQGAGVYLYFNVTFLCQGKRSEDSRFSHYGLGSDVGCSRLHLQLDLPSRYSLGRTRLPYFYNLPLSSPLFLPTPQTTLITLSLLTPLSLTKSPRKDAVSSGHRLFLPDGHLHHHCHSSQEPRRPRRCRSAAPWRCLQRSELRQVLRSIRIARNLVSSSSTVQSGTATQFTTALSGKTVFRAICQ